jgi:hypothetical protein
MIEHLVLAVVLGMVALTAYAIKRAFDANRLGVRPSLYKHGESTVLIFPAAFVTAPAGALFLVALVICGAIAYRWEYYNLVFFKSKTTGGFYRMPMNAWFSVSAAVGDFPINRQVWGFLVGLGCGVRLFTGALPYVVYREALRRRGWSKWLVRAVLVFSIAQPTMLMLLTVLDSRENAFVHQSGSVLVWVLSFVYLPLMTWITRDLKQMNPKRYSKAFKGRQFFFVVHLVTSLMALGFYIAHRTTCADYAYTAFSVAEWAAFLSNICFHLVGEAEDNRNLLVELRFVDPSDTTPLPIE